MEGKMEVGKLLPAKPHFTNPVPLSQTTTLLDGMLMINTESAPFFLVFVFSSFTGLVSITLETGTVTYPGQWDALVKA